MSRKKRKKRSAKDARSRGASVAAAEPEVDVVEDDLDGRLGPEAEGEPRLGRSIVAGYTAAGSSPELLATAFLAILGLWLAYSGSGVIRLASPAVLAQLEALAPIHSLLDVQYLIVANRVLSMPLALGLAGGLVVGRAFLGGYWTSLFIERFEGELDPRRRATAALVRAMRSLPTLVALEALFLGLIMVVPLLLGQLLGVFGALLAVVLAMYFLVLTPIAVVAEGAGLVPSLRLGVRGARLPGRRHLIVVFVYLALTLFLLTAIPADPASPATPSPFVWGYVLLVSFLHVGMLGAITHRWLGIRGEVVKA